MTFDTLRADRLGFAGYARATSPNLDALARSGVRFERALSQAGWTLPSVATILTGLYPRHHGAVEAGRGLAPDVPTLATILADHGYDTRAYVSHLFLHARYGLARGFAIYDDAVLDVGHPHLVASGAALTDRVLADLRTLAAPFFLWIHYFDPHFLYLAHAEWRGFGNSPRDRYDGEIAYTDHELGRLLEELTRRGLLADAVLVATADHGELFGEHPGKFHDGLWNEVLRVPLIIRAPGLEAALRHDAAQQIDLLPTVLGLLGLEAPARLPGRDLFATKSLELPVFVERTGPAPLVQEAVLSEGWKLVRVRVQRGSSARLDHAVRFAGLEPGTYLFDLTRDEGESRNAFRDDHPEARRLQALLDGHLAGGRQGVAIELDRATERRLRSLGYLH